MTVWTEYMCSTIHMLDYLYLHVYMYVHVIVDSYYRPLLFVHTYYSRRRNRRPGLIHSVERRGLSARMALHTSSVHNDRNILHFSKIVQHGSKTGYKFLTNQTMYISHVHLKTKHMTDYSYLIG